MTPSPPKLARWLLRCFRSQEEHESLVGDHDELFQTRYLERGRRIAVSWYWTQVLQSLPSFLANSFTWRWTMLKNFWKIAIRQIKRSKGYTLINISGLAIGMAVSMLILLFVYSELTYDRFNENFKKIYRVEFLIDMQGRQLQVAGSPTPFGPELMKKFPQVENAARLRDLGNHILMVQNRQFDESEIYYADPAVFELFTIPVIQGDPQTFLNAPNSLVITQEMARKYFGEADPLGQVLKVDNQSDFTVTGVVREMPENSHFKFNMLMSLSTWLKGRTGRALWNGFNTITYLMIRDDADIQALPEKFQAVLLAGMPDTVKQLGLKIDLSMQPLKDIHLRSHADGDIKPGGNLSYIRIMATIAFFILLIACINFMNLSTARSAHRAKEVGVRKVMGAQRSRLISQFLAESLVLSLISMVIALVLVLLILPTFNHLIAKNIAYHPLKDGLFTVGYLLLTLFVGLLSGTYPALFLSRYRPIEVFRAKARAGKGHRFLRNGLVNLQYIISIALICSTLVISQQLHFIKHRDLGFKQERVVTIPLRNGEMAQKYAAFKSELLQLPHVINAAVSNRVPGSGVDETYFAFEGHPGDKPEVMVYYSIDEDYLQTLGIQVVQGRNFSEEFPSDREGAMLINETLAKQLGWEDPIGKKIAMTKQSDSQAFFEAPYTVVGVVRDFHFESLHDAIRPLLFKMSGEVSNISVKIQPENMQATLKAIKEKWCQIDPQTPLSYRFLDDSFDALYRSEQRLGQTFIYFTLIAIFIACLGLFGLAAFTAEQRTKEVGIRKVMGASSSGLMLLLSMEFAKWVVMANLVAWPLAYFAMNRWLMAFAYRISLAPWMFIASGLIALAIAMATVSTQAIRTASSNPVKALKYE